MQILIFLLCLIAMASGGVMSAAEAQTLKPGDTLSVSVLQDSKLDRTVIVGPSGQIAFPLAGHFRVQGLTPQAVENILKQKLKSNYRDESLDITVALPIPSRISPRKISSRRCSSPAKSCGPALTSCARRPH